MTEPVVQMLWESSDPGATLRERFGLNDGEAASRWVGRVLGDRFDIRVTGCERVLMSDVNALAWVVTDRGRLIAKWCVAQERFARLDGLAGVVARLGDQGLPVSAPVPALDGSLQVEADGVSLGVQQVIDGDLLDVRDDEAVVEAGRALARLHRGLEHDATAVPGVQASAQPLRSQLGGWIDNAPAHLPRGSVQALRRLLGLARDEPLPRQLVHGDYRSANILYREGRVVAVLDFEEARIDHPVMDLARSAVLLGTQFHDWGPVSGHTRDLLRQGYESVRPLTEAEASWWPALVLWWSLLFVPDGEDPHGWRASAMEQVTTAG